MRNIEKVGELFVGMSSKTFGDVSHNGNASSLNLVPKTKISGKITFPGSFVNLPHSLSSFLPCLNIFEFLESSHVSFPFVVEDEVLTPDSRLHTIVYKGSGI